MVQSGMGYRAVARQLGINHSEVSRLMAKFRQTGDVVDLPRSGQPRKTTPRQDRRLVRMAIQERDSSGPTLARSWSHAIGIPVSAKTVKRRLKSAHLRSRRPRKGAPLTQRHRQARRDWARLRRHHNNRYWRRIYWTDESRYHIQVVDGRKRVWRRPGEQYLPECMTNRSQGYGGSVMIWAAFSYDHKLPLIIIRGNLNGTRYRDEVLDTTIRPHFQLHAADRPLLQDDNARPHRARLVEAYKATNNINSIDWPALSPDLNPIEHLWDHLQQQINKRRPPVTTLQQLETALVQEYNRVPMRFLQRLVRSMPKRCQAVLRARGGHTSY